MLSKAITYEDLDGKQVTETFHFHLNKAEIAELELSYDGGLSAFIKTLVDANDGGVILKVFREIITMTVGRRSEDGKRFEKSKEITAEFMQTGAYSELLMDLAQDADAAVGFIKSVVPSDMAAKVTEDLELPGAKSYSDEELLAMSDTDFDNAVGTDPSKMSRDHLQIAFQRKNRVG